MYTLEQIFEEATRLNKEAEEARQWFWDSLTTEDHVLPEQVLALFGDASRAREWMFTPQNDEGESPAMWLVRGEPKKVVDRLEAIAHGFSA